MKHTQLKDALRNIRKQSLLFLSIVAITTMGTAAYLGIHFSIFGIGRNTSDRYAELNFRDFEIVSTKLLSPADLEALRSLDGVAAVEPVWQTGGKTGAGEVNGDVTVLSITEHINLPILLEGKLPAEPTECAVEERLMETFGWEIGDSIVVESADGGTPESLLNNTFRITCIANHPDHTNLAASDTLYIMVPQEAFDIASLDNCSIKAEIVMEKDANISLFDDAYKSMTDVMKKNLEALALERASLRDAEILAKSNAELDENRQKINEAGEELNEALQKLEEGEAAIIDAEKELSEKKLQLGDAEKTLADAEKALQEGETQLEDAKEQLISGEAALLRANDQLTYAKMLLADANEQMSSAIQTANRLLQAANLSVSGDISLEKLQSLLNDPSVLELSDSLGADEITYWRSQIERLIDLKYQIQYGKKDLENAEAKYYQGLEQYYAGCTEYEKGLREYAEKTEEYADGKREYEEAKEKISEAEEELQAKKKELEEGKLEYQKARTEYQEGQQALAEAEAAVNTLEPARWLILRAMDNTSFAWQNGTVTQTKQIEAVFSSFFLIISILVIYSSIQKLVLEQRSLIGAEKAQGLYNREILFKYLLFGMLGTTAGLLLGTLIAYFVLEPTILKSMNLFVLFDISRPFFNTPSVLLMAAVVELIAFLSVFVGCVTLLQSSATSLMQTPVPKIGKKAVKRQGHSIPLMIRMIPRSMRASPGRVLVTIVSVAGCCSLIVMGFTTKNRVDGVLTHQYPGVTDYDLEVAFDGSPDARTRLEEIFRNVGAEYVLVGEEDVICGEDDRTAATLVVGDLNLINRFYHLRDYATGETLALDREGVYIHRGMSEFFQLFPGDALMISEGFNAPVQNSVAEVYDQYLGWKIFLSDTAYQAAFGKTGIKNLYFVRLGTADETLLKDQLAKVPGFENISAADRDKEMFASVSSTMNMFVILMVVLAGILAAFVIVSLTKCYLLQKNKEAMIMRINGFTFREVTLYLMAEIIADTILGILLGFFLGQSLSVYMLGQMEADFYRTLRGADVPAMLFGAGITILYSLLINAACLRSLKKMKLSNLE